MDSAFGMSYKLVNAYYNKGKLVQRHSKINSDKQHLFIQINKCLKQKFERVYSSLSIQS